MRSKNTVTITSDSDIDAGIAHVMAAIPMASRHAVARAALRAGMPLIVNEPALIVEILARRARPNRSGT